MSHADVLGRIEAHVAAQREAERTSRAVGHAERQWAFGKVLEIIYEETGRDPVDVYTWTELQQRAARYTEDDELPQVLA